MTDDSRYDTIVVGVGAVGNAASYHLARRGDDVLGVERYDVPNAMGSSHGVTRIIRKAYHEHPDYVPLSERAYELWRDLEADHPTDLLRITGSVTVGPADSEMVEGAIETCRRHDLEYEALAGTPSASGTRGTTSRTTTAPSSSPCAPAGSTPETSPSGPWSARRGTSTASRFTACRASRSGSTITDARRWTPTG
jgi:hypothetical protein